MHEQPKVGSKCCGCCCDFRRAVIITDVVLMIFALMSLISIAVPFSERYADSLTGAVDDDQVIEVLDESFLVSSIIEGVGVVCLAVPIYGALKYNVPMVSYGIVWLVLSYIAFIVVSVIYTQKADDVVDENVGMPFLTWIFQGVIAACFIYLIFF